MIGRALKRITQQLTHNVKMFKVETCTIKDLNYKEKTKNLVRKRKKSAKEKI